MNIPVELPTWAALPTAALTLAGATITLLGAIGLLRLPNFYQRAHAPTLGTTLGATCILLASMICFSVMQSRPVLHELLIGAAVFITTPITLVLLVRAALYRDHFEHGDISVGSMPGDDREAESAGNPDRAAPSD